ncbi:hypothetical protein CMI37_20795 [Candidatus Pacearchaeota archaeon]|nr:hypothetical protein [Candidatus Pacearchaeota archaeon]|tara:strand:- start:5510 stop:6202 length:693 start_codon:yes stop_codon:yes gene_type:complete
MKVGIVGSDGNMGRRYAAICNHFQVEYAGYDIANGYQSVYNFIEKANLTHVIIASPTDYHMTHISMAMNHPAKILCEKPFFKDEYNKNLTELQKYINSKNLFMVNQYAYYMNLKELSLDNASTRYNFYNSGNDGIGWDCIQLIYLAQNKTKIKLSHKSPFWDVSINGLTLNKQLIDNCYVDMVEDFLFHTYDKLWGINKIIQAHEDVIAYEKKQSADRDSGSEYKREISK